MKRFERFLKRYRLIIAFVFSILTLLVAVFFPSNGQIFNNNSVSIDNTYDESSVVNQFVIGEMHNSILAPNNKGIIEITPEKEKAKLTIDEKNLIIGLIEEYNASTVIVKYHEHLDGSEEFALQIKDFLEAEGYRVRWHSVLIQSGGNFEGIGYRLNTEYNLLEFEIGKV